jgi:hypothetical protein
LPLSCHLQLTYLIMNVLRILVWPSHISWTLFLTKTYFSNPFFIYFHMPHWLKPFPWSLCGQNGCFMQISQFFFSSKCLNLLLTDWSVLLSWNCCYHMFNASSFSVIAHVDMFNGILLLNTVILKPWTEVPWTRRVTVLEATPLLVYINKVQASH